MNDRQVQVVPGQHLVAAINGAVVVVAHRKPSPLTMESDALKTWTALRDLVLEATAREGDQFGRTLARLATKWIAEQGDDVEFGVLSPAPDGFAVFLFGNVEAVVEHDDKPETLRGAHDPAIAVDMIRPASRRAAIYVVDDDAPSIQLPAERGIGSLVEGVAEGSGAVLWMAEPEPAPVAVGVDHAGAASGPVPRPTPPANVKLNRPKVFETFKLDDKPPPPRSPLPVKPKSRAQGAPADKPRGAAVGHRVRGVKCARGHMNDPRVAFCRLCGLRMNQTKVISEGERPPLGFLVLDDGTTFILHGDLVIGREPEASERVRRGAMPIRLADRAGRLSRAHAEVRLIEWDVTVVDLGSTNGTWVKPSGQERWHQLTPQRPYLLTAGSEVQIGGRRVTFESPHAHI
jgi:FHA domain